MNIDLCRGQADAWGRVHCFKHVINECFYAAVDLNDGLRHLAQAGIWKFEDGKSRHGDNLPVVDR